MLGKGIIHEFKHALGDKVKIKCSNEEGEIIGRAQYVSSDDSFLVRYKAADGRAVENWWCESAIEAV